MMTRLLQVAVGVGLILFTHQALGAKPGFLNPKSFYLTPEELLGDEVVSACADGYHFASLLETRDLSSMRYNFQLGKTWEDTGSGIPSNVAGWIRADGEGPNCDNWNARVDNLGPVGILVPHEIYIFDDPPPGPGPEDENPNPPGDGWEYQSHPCWEAIPAWCVSD